MSITAPLTALTQCQHRGARGNGQSTEGSSSLVAHTRHVFHMIWTAVPDSLISAKAQVAQQGNMGYKLGERLGRFSGSVLIKGLAISTWMLQHAYPFFPRCAPYACREHFFHLCLFAAVRLVGILHALPSLALLLPRCSFVIYLHA